MRDASTMSLLEPAPTETSYACPRCGSSVTEAWYGPCGDCRALLRATLGGAARDVAAVEYEPKMNVTPNAVATKD